MTYVKRGAQIFLVDDSKVSKYTNEGFKAFNPQGKAKEETGTKKEKAETPDPKAGADNGSNGK